MAEKCIFCGWTRFNAAPSTSFYAIPKEPGMKRLQWLYSLNGKEPDKWDRVCGVHFRSGKPSNDPSHDDFKPHLYLGKDQRPELLSYLEAVADNVDNTTPEKRTTPSPPLSSSEDPMDTKPGRSSIGASSTISSLSSPFFKTSRPNILKRKFPVVEHKEAEGSKRKIPDTQALQQKYREEEVKISMLPPSPLAIVQQERMAARYEKMNEELQLHAQYPDDGVDLAIDANDNQSMNWNDNNQTDSGTTYIPISINHQPAPNKRIRLIPISSRLAEAMRARQGQTVIIKKRILVRKQSDIVQS